MVMRWVAGLLVAAALGQGVQAQDLSAPREAAERLVVEGACVAPTPEQAVELSQIILADADGLACATKIIDLLSVQKVAGDPGLVRGADALWSLADLAIVDAAKRPAVRGILDGVRMRLDHPLRSDAWLALKQLDLEEGVLKVAGDPATAAVPTSHKRSIQGDGPEAFSAVYRDAHPLKQRALRWLMANEARAVIGADFSDVGGFGPPPRLQLIKASVMPFGLLNRDFLAEYIDSFFRDGIVLPAASAPVGGSDDLPQVTYRLTGSICADGGACQPLDLEVQGAGKLPQITKTRDLNETGSYAAIVIPYLNATATSEAIGTYGAQVSSYLRGGHWADKVAGIVMNAGDGTASINYQLVAEIRIPKCGDPAACTTQMQLITELWSEPSGGLSQSARLSGPTGPLDLPMQGRVTPIDRSLGDHVLTVTLARNRQHKGACCSDWRSHGFRAGVLRPQDVVPSRLLVPGQNQPPTPPPWIDLPQAESLSVLGQLVIGPRAPGQPVPFPTSFGRLALKQVSYSNRYADLWARLLFTKLALTRGNAELSPGEKSDLTALQQSLSKAGREQLLEPLQAELQAWSWASQALDTEVVNYAIAALVRNTDVVQTISAAEVAVLERLARDNDTPVAASLRKAAGELKAAREADSRLDALMHVLKAEYVLRTRSREARLKYDRLTREIAELLGPSP